MRSKLTHAMFVTFFLGGLVAFAIKSSSGDRYKQFADTLSEWYSGAVFSPVDLCLFSTAGYSAEEMRREWTLPAGTKSENVVFLKDGSLEISTGNGWQVVEKVLELSEPLSSIAGADFYRVKLDVRTSKNVGAYVVVYNLTRKLTLSDKIIWGAEGEPIEIAFSMPVGRSETIILRIMPYKWDVAAEKIWVKNVSVCAPSAQEPYTWNADVSLPNKEVLGISDVKLLEFSWRNSKILDESGEVLSQKNGKVHSHFLFSEGATSRLFLESGGRKHPVAGNDGGVEFYIDAAIDGFGRKSVDRSLKLLAPVMKQVTLNSREILEDSPNKLSLRLFPSFGRGYLFDKKNIFTLKEKSIQDSYNAIIRHKEKHERELKSIWPGMTDDERLMSVILNVVANLWRFGNEKLVDRVGCIMSNERIKKSEGATRYEDNRFPEIYYKKVEDIPSYLNATIACCNDFAAFVAIYLKLAGFDSKRVTIPGHIFNEVTLPSGKTYLLDASVAVVVNRSFHELLGGSAREAWLFEANYMDSENLEYFAPAIYPHFALQTMVYGTRASRFDLKGGFQILTDFHEPWLIRTFQ